MAFLEAYAIPFVIIVIVIFIVWIAFELLTLWLGGEDY